MHKKIALRILSTSLFMVVASCAPTIKKFDEYQKTFAPKTEFMPDPSVIEGKKLTKVVVFSFDENSDQVAKNAGLGLYLAASMENILSKRNLAEIIDRKAAEKLRKEIQLSEMKNTGSYNGPKISDYAISGTISGASFTKEFKSGFTYIDTSGKLVAVPPKFKYTSNVSGNIKIYELPSLSVIKNIDFSGSSIRSENVKTNGGVSILGVVNVGGESANGDERDDNLVRLAASNAVENASIDIKNFFAKRGYILEKRIRNNKSIFKISLGSSDGVVQGDKLKITTKSESQNPITEKMEIEQKIIATGVVADKIYDKSSWILIDDNDSINKIRIGDTVQVVYKRNFLQSLTH